MRVLLDTNFLLIPGTLKIDIYSQLKEIDPSVQIYIIDKSIDELEHIKKQKKFQKAAIIALGLLKTQEIKVIKTEKVKNVDDLIVDKAKRGFIVATQDKELKRRLKFQGTKIIVLRQKQYVKVE